jgi:hypothetical protein
MELIIIERWQGCCFVRQPRGRGEMLRTDTSAVLASSVTFSSQITLLRPILQSPRESYPRFGVAGLVYGSGSAHKCRQIFLPDH